MEFAAANVKQARSQISIIHYASRVPAESCRRWVSVKTARWVLPVRQARNHVQNVLSALRIPFSLVPVKLVQRANGLSMAWRAKNAQLERQAHLTSRTARIAARVRSGHSAKPTVPSVLRVRRPLQIMQAVNSAQRQENSAKVVLLALLVQLVRALWIIELGVSHAAMALLELAVSVRSVKAADTLCRARRHAKHALQEQ